MMGQCLRGPALYGTLPVQRKFGGRIDMSDLGMLSDPLRQVVWASDLKHKLPVLHGNGVIKVNIYAPRLA